MPGRRRPRRAELGVSVGEYDRLLEAQAGNCAICPATPKTRRFNVDHDHATMEIRGLLCHRCNRMLPAWMRPAWLLAAYAYMNGHRTDAAGVELERINARLQSERG